MYKPATGVLRHLLPVLLQAPKLLSMDDTKHVLANLAPKNPSTEEMSGMARILRYYQV